MKSQNNSVHYEIYADNCDGTVIVKNLQQENYFICLAREVVSNKKLLEKFSGKDAKHINAIAYNP